MIGEGQRLDYTFLVLDLGLDVVDGVAALDLERDRLPRQRLYEDLHLACLDCSLSLRPSIARSRRVVVVWWCLVLSSAADVKCLL